MWPFWIYRVDLDQSFIPKVGGNHIRRNNIFMYLGIAAEITTRASRIQFLAPPITWRSEIASNLLFRARLEEHRY